MAKANASYETIFVVDLRLGEDAVKSVVEKFTSMIGANGEIAEVNEWQTQIRLSDRRCQ